ncbi:MAG: flagellar assembly peptidoglycan hydrolase FlgJ [Gammaproteobacteria bacterium]|nr:flagellar assembly peptidoglycan hydrolase FlgJ [Gammaproteobacteria bacterium]
MTATAANALDFSRFAEVKRMARGDSPEAYKEIGREFEAMLFQMMLKSARDTLPGDSLFGGNEMEIYQDMFDQQAALAVAAQGRLGIADAIAAQLSGQSVRPAIPGTVEGEGLRTFKGIDRYSVMASATAQVAGATALKAVDDSTPTSAEDFVASLLPHAQRAAKALGVDPAVIVAQAVLETGWGQRQIRASDGTSSNNVFGIKQSHGWRGAVVNTRTTEYQGGQAHQQTAAFRSYANLDAAFGDYVEFLSGNERYRDALGAGTDARRFAVGLQRAGYATDPAYARKIIDLLPRVRLHMATASAPAAINNG